MMMSDHNTIPSNSETQPQNNVLLPADATLPPLSSLFPEDITVEILSRLPVKSLLRFSCVHKSWDSLFSSSHFIKHHLHRSTTDPNHNHHRLVGLQTSSDVRVLYLSRSLPSLINDPSEPIFCYPPFELCPHPMIVGSCNGLICWINFDNRHIYYLNTSLRVQSRFPYWIGARGRPWLTVFGFGYDRLSDSYKTVAIHCDPRVEKPEKLTTVGVFTLGWGEHWRRMESFPFTPVSSHGYGDICGKFVSGTINWLGRLVDGFAMIVSVDIGNETCGMVMLPDVIDKYKLDLNAKLWVLGDCLCFSQDLSSDQFALWQMKEYGVTESWTKLLTISYQETGIYQNLDYPKPIFMLDIGEVLVQINSDGEFILYNPRDNSFKCFNFGSYVIWFKGMCAHIDSLVCPCPAHH